jgi:hypothetical protein
VCQRFLDEITLPAEPARDWTFYEAGGFYFIATANRADLTLRTAPLIVYDSTFTVRKVLGM